MSDAPEIIGLVGDGDGYWRLWDREQDLGRYIQTPATEYVRADLHAALTAERDALREDVRRMTETIRAAQHELINRGGTYALPILIGEVPLKAQTDE